MKKATFCISFRCFYPNGEHTNHRQEMKLSDIAKWIEAYQFTHPDCNAITVKVWLNDTETII